MRPHKLVFITISSRPRGILNHRDSLIAVAAPGTFRRGDESQPSNVANVCAGNAQNRRGIMRQKQNKAVHQKKKGDQERKGESERLFHRVTANSLAACQDETPTEREERRKRLVFAGWRDRISRLYGNVSSVCSEIYSRSTRELDGVCFLPSRNSPPFSLPSGVSSAAENRMKTSAAFLFTSIGSQRVSIVYNLFNIRCWCECSRILSSLSE